MYLVGNIKSRSEFAPWLVSMGLGNEGTAVEVGTHRGEFAATFMSRWPGKLICVDPWTIPKGYEQQAKQLHKAGATRNEDFLEAKRVLAPYGENRVAFWRMLSHQAAPLFKDHAVDFVYIDGCHLAASTLRDLECWWPKVRPGGVLAGHDIMYLPGQDNWGASIQWAVERFAGGSGEINLVPEPNGPWSYYLVKPS